MATMDSDGSAVAISEAVEERLPDLREDLGAGATLTVVSDQGPAVSKADRGPDHGGRAGCVFAVVVILVFLASVRSTLVTAVSIPLSDGPRADRAVDARPVAEHADAGRADHRHRPR
ncbi:hypothetical protein SGRIM128S_07516 [Streptomyces griseomycini]